MLTVDMRRAVSGLTFAITANTVMNPRHFAVYGVV
jgi:hypothetical protein